jgi:hypothetical protein
MQITLEYYTTYFIDTDSRIAKLFIGYLAAVHLVLVSLTAGICLVDPAVLGKKFSNKCAQPR